MDASRSKTKYAQLLALLVAAFALAFAFAPSNAYADDLTTGAFQTQATTKASLFTYKVGDYYGPNPANGFETAVISGKWKAGTTKLSGGRFIKQTKTYGVSYEAQYGAISGGNGWGGASNGFNCGHGVYITGYKGKANTNVVIPDKINGVPVVYAQISAKHIKTLDVSRCAHLKALEFAMHGNARSIIDKVKFGKNPRLKSVYVMHTTFKSALSISPKKLEDLKIYQNVEARKGWSFSSNKLKSLELFGQGGLYLGENKKLENLRLSFSTVDSFSLDKMPALKKLSLLSSTLQSTLYPSKAKKLRYAEIADCSMNSKTKSNFKKWGKISGHTLKMH